MKNKQYIPSGYLFEDACSPTAGSLGGKLLALLMDDIDIRVDGPAGESLFAYDTFIVESFLDEPVDIQIVTGGQVKALHDLDIPTGRLR